MSGLLVTAMRAAGRRALDPHNQRRWITTAFRNLTVRNLGRSAPTRQADSLLSSPVTAPRLMGQNMRVRAYGVADGEVLSVRLDEAGRLDRTLLREKVEAVLAGAPNNEIACLSYQEAVDRAEKRDETRAEMGPTPYKTALDSFNIERKLAEKGVRATARDLTCDAAKRAPRVTRHPDETRPNWLKRAVINITEALDRKLDTSTIEGRRQARHAESEVLDAAYVMGYGDLQRRPDDQPMTIESEIAEMVAKVSAGWRGRLQNQRQLAEILCSEEATRRSPHLGSRDDQMADLPQDVRDDVYRGCTVDIPAHIQHIAAWDDFDTGLDPMGAARARRATPLLVHAMQRSGLGVLLKHMPKIVDPVTRPYNKRQAVRLATTMEDILNENGMTDPLSFKMRGKPLRAVQRLVLRVTEQAHAKLMLGKQYTQREAEAIEDALAFLGDVIPVKYFDALTLAKVCGVTRPGVETRVREGDIHPCLKAHYMAQCLHDGVEVPTAEIDKMSAKQLSGLIRPSFKPRKYQINVAVEAMKEHYTPEYAIRVPAIMGSLGELRGAAVRYMGMNISDAYEFIPDVTTLSKAAAALCPTPPRGVLPVIRPLPESWKAICLALKSRSVQESPKKDGYIQASLMPLSDGENVLQSSIEAKAAVVTMERANFKGGVVYNEAGVGGVKRGGSRHKTEVSKRFLGSTPTDQGGEYPTDEVTVRAEMLGSIRVAHEGLPQIGLLELLSLTRTFEDPPKEAPKDQEASETVVNGLQNLPSGTVRTAFKHNPKPDEPVMLGNIRRIPRVLVDVLLAGNEDQRRDLSLAEVYQSLRESGDVLRYLNGDKQALMQYPRWVSDGLPKQLESLTREEVLGLTSQLKGRSQEHFVQSVIDSQTERVDVMYPEDPAHRQVIENGHRIIRCLGGTPREPHVHTGVPLLDPYVFMMTGKHRP